MGGCRGRVAPWIGAVLLGSLAAGAPLAGPRAGSAEGFGRWDTPLRLCRMSSPGRAERPCRRLRLEQNLEFLATVGSISPYVGLFGTVWGIMIAFHGLANVREATIAMVASPRFAT